MSLTCRFVEMCPRPLHLTVANEKARHILENHVPKPLDDSIKENLREIVESRNK